MIKAIAIDDEPVALSVIDMHGQKVPFLSLEKIFINARAALDYMAQYEIDLVFLDINMPNMGGLEFAAHVDPAVQIVFTTAHSQHAVKGFDIDIADFLLKPITYPRFLQACERVQKKLDNNNGTQRTPGQESLFVKDGYNWVRIFLSDILYVKAEDNYLNFIENNRKTLVRMTVTEFFDKVPPDSFIRVHRSYIVNPSTIAGFNKDIILANGETLPVSKTFLNEVRKYLTVK